MKSPQSPFAVKLLPSLTDFAFLMPIVFLFGRMDGTKSLLSDCDTGWHIRTGEWILRHHQIPKQDVFSFSMAGQPWYAWEWLTDVLYAWLNSYGGLAAVVLLSVLLLSATFTILFRLSKRRANPVIAVVVTMVAAASSAIHWLARPHLFTLLFVVLFYGALENVRAGRTRIGRVPYLAILPVATVIWTNLHGGFVVGIVLLGGYGAGELLKMALAADRSIVGASWIRARNYFATALGCLAASFINPYFYHLHVHVVEYLADPYQAQHIVEFLSLNFHHPVAIFFEMLLVLGAAAAIWHASQGSYTEAVILGIWAHGALLAARNIPLYGIVAAPAVSAALDAWLKKLPELEVAAWLKTAAGKVWTVMAETAETDGLSRWHAVSAAGFLLVAALLYAPHPPQRFVSQYDPKSYPAGAVAMLRQQPPARIFSNDEWGDYLIYKLYPRDRVFVDGRSDFYGDDFVKKYLDVMSVRYDWEKTLDGYGIDTILLSPGAPLAGALKESSRWRVVYDDGIALVFRPAGKPAGASVSNTLPGEGRGRDREVTKTQARDPVITAMKSKT